MIPFRPLALAAVASLLSLPVVAEDGPPRSSIAAAKARALEVQSAYPVIVTAQWRACRDFYVRHLGFEVGFEASWFVYLANGAAAIAFMAPDHPSSPPGPETFDGRGAFVTLQVADARAAFERVKASGTPIAYALRDEAWGQRRFGLVDPAGQWVDVVQQIEPAKGYWERYAPR